MGVGIIPVHSIEILGFLEQHWFILHSGHTLK